LRFITHRRGFFMRLRPCLPVVLVALAACAPAAAAPTALPTPPPGAIARQTQLAELIATATALHLTVTAPSATPAPRTASLAELANEVNARSDPAGAWQAAALGQTIVPGGGVQTGADARARLDLSDASILRLGANTEFTLTDVSPDAPGDTASFVLSVGQMWLFVAETLGGGSFDVNTPVGVASVRGSWMGVEYHPANAHMIITCLEGECALTNSAGVRRDLVAGQQAGIKGVNDPTQPITIDAARMAEWLQFVPEAQQFSATITPGPLPTATPTFTQIP
jgi:ferric-dicitrate binding protein FerR (iron transport regulator)